MPDNSRRLILGNGEQYVTPHRKTSHGGPTEMPRPFDDARERARTQVQAALHALRDLPNEKRLPNEGVLCLRLHPDMLAKSYDPEGIFALVPDLANVGSRMYRIPAADVAQTKRIKRQLEQQVEEVLGRVVFIRSTDQGFRRLLRALDQPARQLTGKFKEDIQRVESFDILTREEQLLGFEADWQQGRVELVLHPTIHGRDIQTNFLEGLFATRGRTTPVFNIVPYENGPTFVSCYLTRSQLNLLAGANPLRTAHPFAFAGFEPLRSSPRLPSPLPPIEGTRSTIKIGMFDGGIDKDHPLLIGHVEEDDGLSIATTATKEGVAHGTAVAGAILYGHLNDRDAKAPLSTPAVSVVSFRVLPTSNSSDIDLYEAIDVIERVVPTRKDLTIYNLSFGPRGPILDDSISRFTFSLDSLATAHRVTFVVAVGNDGDAGPGLDRIQSPSDLVNGLGVAASTNRNGADVRAPYSCIGPGRECGKLKPDVAAPGGCDQAPVHLVSAKHGEKALSYGTSFAAPLASSLTGQLAGAFDRSSALLARALVIHFASHPNGAPDHFLGHGLIPKKLEDVIRCVDDNVTVLFQGDMVPKKTVKLPIMFPRELEVEGKVEIRWTIAGLPRVSASHPADYTTCCIEDTFYPHSDLFLFTRKEGDKTKTLRINVAEKASELSNFYADGWTRSEFPMSDSGNKYPVEYERRLVEYKWEPIVRRSVTKRLDSLNDPFLTLHAIPRNGASERFDYAAIVTISVPGCSGDIYSSVLQQFQALQPIRLRSEAELRITI